MISTQNPGEVHNINSSGRKDRIENSARSSKYNDPSLENPSSSALSHEELNYWKFLFNRIVEQPFYFILLVSLITIIGMLEFFIIKGQINDISYKLKDKKEEKNPQSALSAARSNSDAARLDLKSNGKTKWIQHFFETIIRHIGNAFNKILTYFQWIKSIFEKMDLGIDWIINQADLTDEKKKKILKVLIYLGISRTFSSLLTSCVSYISIKLSSRLMAQMTNAIFAKIQNLSPEYFEEKDSIGTLSKNFETSITALKNMFLRIAKLARNFVEAGIIFCCTIANSNIILGVTTTIWLVIHAIICMSFRDTAKQAHDSVVKLEGKRTAYFMERLRNKHIETFLDLKKENIENYEKITGKARDIGGSLAAPVFKLFFTVSFVATMLQIVLFTSLLVYFDDISDKTKVAIFTSNLAFIDIIYSISQDIPRIIEDSSQVPKIFDIINNPKNQTRRRKNLKITDAAPSIEGRNLSLHNGEKAIFENLSFSIPHGSNIAIVGASGGGKTTFINMIAGLNEKYTGQLMIGGVDVKDISRRSLEEAIAYVFASQNLLSGSLRDNITMGRQIEDDEYLMDILELCELHEVVEKIGLDTPLGEGEGILSTGEKKRVMIARTIYNRIELKKIFLLDELLSNLDSATARNIYEVILLYIEGRPLKEILRITRERKSRNLQGEKRESSQESSQEHTDVSDTAPSVPSAPFVSPENTDNRKTVMFIDHSGLLEKEWVFFFPKNRKMIINKHAVLLETDEEYRSMMTNSPLSSNKNIKVLDNQQTAIQSHDDYHMYDRED
jgi:ABC-type multidrug transport system fused ATPase/permease subunit